MQSDPTKVIDEGEAISQEKVEQLLEEFESESPTRKFSGIWRVITGVLAASLSIYALYWTQYSITTGGVYAGMICCWRWARLHPWSIWS